MPSVDDGLRATEDPAAEAVRAEALGPQAGGEDTAQVAELRARIAELETDATIRWWIEQAQVPLAERAGMAMVAVPMHRLRELAPLLERLAGLDRNTGSPIGQLDRDGTLWTWGFDGQCQRWGYQSPGGGHARSLDELRESTRAAELGPLTPVPWRAAE